MIGQPPFAAPITDKDGRITKSASEWLSKIGSATESTVQFGTTAQRPTSGLWIGRRYYDTTLGKPVWVNSVSPSIVWKDASGTTV